MKSFDKASFDLSAFRQQAESIMKEQQLKNNHPESSSGTTLEMNLLQLQNEALLNALELQQRQLNNYSKIIENTGQAYFSIDRQGNITGLNHAGALLIGGPENAVIHQPFASFVAAASQLVFTHFLQDIFGNSKVVSCEAALISLTGKPFYVSIQAIAADAHTECMLLVNDITATEKSATITLKSDEKYKMLIEQAYDGVLIYNPEGVLIQWNEKAQRFLGYDYDEFKGLRLSDLFFKEELVLRPLSFKKLREGETVLDYRKLQRKDGTGIEMEINSKMLSDGNVIVFGRDISERKRAEEEKTRLSNTLQKSLDEIFMFDAATWLFEYANDGALKNTGYSETELLKLSPWDLVRGTTRQARELVVQPLVKNQKEKIVFEATHSRKDGTYYPVEVHVQLIDQEDKKIFLVNARDISERINAAIKLKRAYEILEETNKIARIGSYEVNVKNGFVKWSPVTCDIHELPADYKPELQTAINFYKEGQSRDTISKLVDAAMEKGMPFDTELLLVTAKGNDRWVRATGHTEFEGGACVRLFGTFQDIHSRKLAEEELSAKEKYFRALIEHSSSAIVLFDEKGNFIYQSPVVEKILGYVIDGKEDKNVFGFIHPDDTESFFRQMVEIIANPDLIQTGAYRFRHADGHYVWLEGSVTNRLNDKNVRALIANYQDVTERMAVADRIKAERSLLRTLIDNLPDLIYVKDLEGRKVLSNKADLIYMGVAADSEIIGKTDLEIFPGSVGQYGHDKDLSVMKESIAIYNMEEYFNDIHGTPHWMLTSKVPLLNADGTVSGLLGIGRDITNRKNSEQALIKSNERFEYATQATSDAVWDWDMVSNELFWGKNYETIFGHNGIDSKANLQAWNKNIHPDDFDRVEKSLQKAKEEAGSIWAEEYRFKKANGEFAHVQDKGIIIRNDKGLVTRMIGAMQDISHRKAQEETLKLLQSVVTNTTDAIIITEAEPFDLPGPKILYVNNAFTNITGYSPGEIIGKTPRILQGKKTDRRELEKLKASLRKWEACEVEIINYKKNGEEFWVNFVVVPVADDRGYFTHWVSIQRDITQRKIAETKLQTLNDELAKQANALSLSNNELERFAYVASHDLQEPLRMVSSFMKLLEAKYKPQLDDTAKQYIHFAVDGAERMKHLIHDLLEYSRVSTNKEVSGNTDMNQVVKDVLAVLMITINELDASVEVGTLPVLANTRSTLLFQLMQNLIGNALKYHGNQKTVIKIKAKEESDSWQFEVADNGIGIDPSFAEKIFVIFQRLHNKDEFSGTGIGLSICKKIVEMHGGQIWVEPNAGSGSVFYFTLVK